jgi:hypothetical protein
VPLVELTTLPLSRPRTKSLVLHSTTTSTGSPPPMVLHSTTTSTGSPPPTASQVASLKPLTKTISSGAHLACGCASGGVEEERAKIGVLSLLSRIRTQQPSVRRVEGMRPTLVATSTSPMCSCCSAASRRCACFCSSSPSSASAD